MNFLLSLIEIGLLVQYRLYEPVWVLFYIHYDDFLSIDCHVIILNYACTHRHTPTYPISMKFRFLMNFVS